MLQVEGTPYEKSWKCKIACAIVGKLCWTWGWMECLEIKPIMTIERSQNDFHISQK